MSILKKFKLWWKSSTSAEKVCIILSGISTVASVTGAVCAVRTRNSFKDIKLEVTLVPEKSGPIPLKHHEDSEEKEETPPDPEQLGEYDRAAALLKTLWIVDDLLFPENYREAVAQAESLQCYMRHPAQRIMDILERARGEDLDQEDLFEVQGEVEDLTRYLAERDGRMDEFKEQFSWLNYIPKEVKGE